MDRRAFVRLSGLGAMGLCTPAFASSTHAERDEPRPDITLRIAPVTVDVTSALAFSTIGYNGACPGPVLRMKEGVPQLVEVINETDVPEQVHWHGLLLPADLDGAEEEGTPVIPPRGRRRFTITPTPAGTRWYHTHSMAMDDLHRGGYTGQFGFLVVEGPRDAGSYDQEVFLALRDWEPFFTSQMPDVDSRSFWWPQPERPATMPGGPNGLEVSAAFYSINDKALGAGDPIRVRAGERVLFRLLNASAIENRVVALAGHQFRIVALDGNPVPNPQLVDQVLIGSGERVDAVVEMNRPGVWILGAVEDRIRNAGLGVVVEYADQRRRPEWSAPGRLLWDYADFGRAAIGVPAAAESPDTIAVEMIFDKVPCAYGRFNGFTVNGASYPHAQEFVLHEGRRYRLAFRNRTADSHPVHLHRHSFELVEIFGKPTAGVVKDTVVVPGYGRAVVEFVADQPGPTLLHCHIQQHMDYGFKALLRYA